MPTVLQSELIVSAYLSPFLGIQRRAQELLEKIERSVRAGIENWIVLGPALDKALSFIAEQDITQNVKDIYNELKRRGIEIVDQTDVSDVWAQIANDRWEDAEILYAIGQQFPIFAFFPEKFAQSVQACEQRYRVSLSALRVSSDADLELSLSQNSGASPNDGAYKETSSDSNTDSARSTQPTASRASLKVVIVSRTLFSWIFASLIPIFLSRQGQFSISGDREAVGASDFTPQRDPELLPPAVPHPNGLETNDSHVNRALVSDNGHSPFNNSTLHTALWAGNHTKHKTAATDDLMGGGDRHPFFDEGGSTDISSRPTSITLSDWTKDTVNQGVEGDTLSLQVSSVIDFNQFKPEKLPQPIASENQSSSNEIFAPIVPRDSDPQPQKHTPHHRPAKPHSHPAKPEPPQPTPSDTPLPTEPLPTPGNLLTSPDTSLVPSVDSLIESPTLAEANGGSDPEQPNESPSTTKNVDSLGGRFTIEISPGAGQIIINHFGGVGTGTCPSQAIIDEADTLKFTGDAAFSDQNMLLIPKGEDLLIRFEGVARTEVILKNFQMENLDNLLKPSASVDLPNILFNEQNSPQDSYDVFNADWDRQQVLNPDTVTFLNDRDNFIAGFESSNDVINGQGGNDTLIGLRGDDVLRGENGDDILLGGSGNNTLIGGEGKDTFVLSTDGFSQINDFTPGQDLIGLPEKITYEQLEIRQGIGSNSSNTWILLDNKLLALVKGTQANDLTATNFFLMPDNRFSS